MRLLALLLLAGCGGAPFHAWQEPIAQADAGEDVAPSIVAAPDAAVADEATVALDAGADAADPLGASCVYQPVGTCTAWMAAFVAARGLAFDASRVLCNGIDPGSPYDSIAFGQCVFLCMTPDDIALCAASNPVPHVWTSCGIGGYCDR